MSKINTEFDTLFSSQCLWLDQIIPANGYSWWLACFFTSPFQCPRMAHTGFSGSCAKIDLWWIREATGVTCFGCSCISYITAHFGDEVPDSGRWDSNLVFSTYIWAEAKWLHRWAIYPSLAATFILKNKPEHLRCLFLVSTVSASIMPGGNLPAAASGVHLCYLCSKPKWMVTSRRTCNWKSHSPELVI